MKKFITALTALLAFTVAANAMSYSQAREQALFLTDKMAYELNLTEEQYDAAYEVNLDYLMSIGSHDDLYGTYWTQRNLDLSYILLDWQYRMFCAASYFYRPLYWTAGVWHFAVYTRYPRRDYFYFGRPNIYITYRGGHGWRHNGGRSWYKGRTFNRGHISKGHGMRDRLDRGDFHRDKKGGFRRSNGRDNRFSGNGGNNRNDRKPRPDNNQQNNKGSFRNPSTTVSRLTGTRANRKSSTRATAKPSTRDNNTDRRIESGRQATRQRKPNNTFTPRNSTSGSQSVSRSTPARSFKSNSSGSRRITGSSRGGHSGGNR